MNLPSSKNTTNFLLADAPVLVSKRNAYIWIHSDLQLGNIEEAKSVLSKAIEDVLSLDRPIDAIWSLGDVLGGKQVDQLDAIAKVVIDQFARLSAPVCYVMGNHEMDLARSGISRFPLYEAAQAQSHWHIPESVESRFFTQLVCGVPVVFLNDPTVSEFVINENRLDDQLIIDSLRQAMANHPGPVITASHYAYPGGQRPSEWLRQLLPLPPNVCLHLHGHAHIGDLVFNSEDPWERRHGMDGQESLELRQINISAMESRRSPGSHSAFLEMGEQGPISLRIRCHLERRWEDSHEGTKTRSKN